MPLAAAAAILFCAAMSCKAETSYIAVVSAHETNLYEGPGRKPLEIKLMRGSMCRLLETSTHWRKVRLRNGITGWLPVWETEIFESGQLPPDVPPPGSLGASPGKPVAGIVISDYAQLRSEPTTALPATRDHTRIGIAQKGAALHITGYKGHWLKIRTSQFGSAWVYDESLAFAPYVSATWPAKASGVSIYENDRQYIVSINTSERVPFLARGNARSVSLSLYGAQYAGARQEEGEAANPAEDFLRIQKGYAAVELTFPLSYAPRGFTAGYSGNNLVLAIRKPRPPSPYPDAPLAGLRVCIDPGHGSASNPPGLSLGASSKRFGIREHELNLAVSMRLAQLVQQAGGEPILTRMDRTDETNSLYRRVEIARNAEADVFISIHANSSASSKPSGFEAYWFEPQSEQFAETVVAAVAESTGRGKGRSAFSSFGVIRQTDMPAALLELGYLSNTSDSAFFVSPGAIDKYATGILNGIIDYFRN